MQKLLLAREGRELNRPLRTVQPLMTGAVRRVIDAQELAQANGKLRVALGFAVVQAVMDIAAERGLI